MVASNAVPSSQPDRGIAALIADLKRRLDEQDRKTLGSVAVSLGNNRFLSVHTDPVTGVAQIEISDSAGNVLVANDVIAGWGLGSPSFPFPVYSTQAMFLQNSSILSTWTAWYTGSNTINNPRLNISYTASLGVAAAPGSSATASYRVTATLPGGSPVVINPTADTLTNSVAGSEVHHVTSFTYDWPTDVFGQVVFLSLESELTAQAGGDSGARIFPAYCWGGGRS